MGNFGPIRSSKASVSSRDLAAPSDELLSVALCLRESQGEIKGAGLIPIQGHEHLRSATLPIERNPVRANFVEAAEAWRWSSAIAQRWTTRR